MVFLINHTECDGIQNVLHSTYRSLFGTWEYGTSSESFWSDILHEQCVLTCSVEKTVTAQQLLVWKKFPLPSIRDIFFWFWVLCTWGRMIVSTFRASYTKLLKFWTTKYRPNTFNILVGKRQIVVFTVADNRLHFFPTWQKMFSHAIPDWANSFQVSLHIFQTTNLCKL